MEPAADTLGTVPEEPRVTSLATTPIKGFALSSPDQVSLDANGAVGDRDFLVVDAKNTLLSATRTGVFMVWRAQFDRVSAVLTITSSDGRMLQGSVDEGESTVVDLWGRPVAGFVAAGPWTAWLSEIAGQPVSLIRTVEPGGANDEAPVTLISDDSVAEVALLSGSGPLDAARFRMLINLSGARPFEEESWAPAQVRLGTALLRMRGPVPRCLATTRNPHSGDKDLRTLKLIAAARGPQPNEFGRGLNLGAYAEVVEPGVVSVGDRVEVL